MTGKRFVRILALGAVLALAAAACSNKTAAPGPSSSAPSGGTFTVGVEQWPACVNPIVTGCAAASWTQWAVYNQIYPKALAYDPASGTMKATALLTDTPSLSNGEVKALPSGGMQITYHINPAAKWSDNTPITSKDFDFTRKAMIATTGSYYSAGSGYDLITGIDTSDPQTAVVTYSEVYTDWPDDFGGLTEVLEAHSYESRGISATKPDLAKIDQTSTPYSGGPWLMTQWSKSQEILVPNKNYWVKSDIPVVDKAVLVPREDQTAEVNSVLSGEVDAISPQPGNVSFIKEVASNQNIKVNAQAGAGGFWEAMWINDDKTFPAVNGAPNPMNDPKVREAFFYAVDRDQVINGLIKLNNPNATVLNCGLLAFPGTPWCQKTYFDQFHYDATKSVDLLKADGWDCSKVPASPCTKNGMDLNLVYRTVAGNARRETIETLIKEKIGATGFNFTFKNAEATQLFGTLGPQGNGEIFEFAQGGTIDPSPTAELACKGVPTKANSFGGNNFDRWCDPTFDKLLAKGDQQLDPAKRLPILEQIFSYQVAHFIMLPLYVLPQMLVYNATKVASSTDINEWVPTPEGPLYGMNHWYVV